MWLSQLLSCRIRKRFHLDLPCCFPPEPKPGFNWAPQLVSFKTRLYSKQPCWSFSNQTLLWTLLVSSRARLHFMLHCWCIPEPILPLSSSTGLFQNLTSLWALLFIFSRTQLHSELPLPLVSFRSRTRPHSELSCWFLQEPDFTLSSSRTKTRPNSELPCWALIESNFTELPCWIFRESTSLKTPLLVSPRTRTRFQSEFLCSLLVSFRTRNGLNSNVPTGLF